MKVFAKYFHVSRIPSFPMGKIGIAVCEQCQYSVDDKSFKHQQSYYNAYRQIKAKTTTPYWACAGTGVMLLLLSLAGYNMLAL